MAVAARAGRLQDTVRTWHPAARLITMQALRPLAIQVLYSTVKSAAVMAGDGPGQAGVSPRAHTQLLTTLTLVGEPREVGG